MATAKKKPSTIDKVLEKHEPKQSSLIPLLQNVQAELGYLSTEAILGISRHLKITEAEVYGVATFFAQFRFTPAGRNKITVCAGTACHVRGGAAVLREFESATGIKNGETSEDLEFTLETVGCVGSCALAPVTVVNGKVHPTTSTSDTHTIVDNCKG